MTNAIVGLAYLLINVCFFGKPLIASFDSMLDMLLYLYLCVAPAAGGFLALHVSSVTICHLTGKKPQSDESIDRMIESLFNLIRLGFIAPLWTSALWFACNSFDQSGITNYEKFGVSMALIVALCLFSVGRQKSVIGKQG